MSGSRVPFYPTTIQDAEVVDTIQELWKKLEETAPGKYNPHKGDMSAAKEAERARKRHLDLGTSAWLWEAAATARGLAHSGLHLLPTDLAHPGQTDKIIPFDLMRVAAERRTKGLSTDYILANDRINFESDLKSGETPYDICVGFADRGFMEMGANNARAIQKDEPVFAKAVFADQLKFEKAREVMEDPKKFSYRLPEHVSLEATRKVDSAVKKMIGHYGRVLLYATKENQYVEAISKAMTAPYKDLYQNLKSFREHYTALSKSSSMVGATLTQGISVLASTVRVQRAAKMAVFTMGIIVTGMAAAAHALHIPLPAPTLTTMVADVFQKATGVAGSFSNFLENVGHTMNTFLGSIEHSVREDVPALSHAHEHAESVPVAPALSQESTTHIAHSMSHVNHEATHPHATHEAKHETRHEHVRVTPEMEQKVLSYELNEVENGKSPEMPTHIHGMTHEQIVEAQKDLLSKEGSYEKNSIDATGQVGNDRYHEHTETAPTRNESVKVTMSAQEFERHVTDDINRISDKYPEINRDDQFHLAKGGDLRGEVVRVDDNIGAFYVKNDTGIHIVYGNLTKDAEGSNGVFHIKDNHVMDRSHIVKCNDGVEVCKETYVVEGR